MQRRKSGIYEFRQRLPSTLAGKAAPPQLRTVVPELINPKTGLFKRELVASLQTHDATTAKRKNLKEALRASRLFDHAAQLMTLAASPAQRPGPVLSPAEIEEEAYRAVLAGDEEERELGDARRYHQTRAEREQWPDLADAKLGQRGMAAGHLELLGDLNTEDLESYRRAWAQRDMEPVRGELHAFLTKRGLPIDPTSAWYREAGLALLRGRVRAHEAIAQRQAGGIVETPQSAPAARGPKLSEAFAMWKNGTQARGGKKPTATTVREAERAIRYFTDYHGDLRLGDISKELARDFRNALSRLPTRLTVPQRKMGLRALLRDADTSGQEPIHAASVNKYLNILVAIVSAAEREGVMDKVAGFANPFSRLGLTIDKRNDPNRRMPFNEAQLSALFTTGVFKAAERPRGGSGEAAYWLPLIALLSGARLNEIAQLRLVDLARDPETGICFIDIGTEGGRAIKTATSRRRVPVHAELIRLGLLRYREAALKAAGGKQDAPLWPELGSAHDTYRSTAWSKWFNRYLRVTASITDSALVFHSFRHTFKRRARDAGVSEELSDALTGHGGEASIGRSYGAGFGLKALHEAVGRIEAPDAIKALPEWRPGKARENGGSNAAA